MSTNIEVHREKAEVRNNLDKEELLTDKYKNHYRKNFTDNRHERRRGKSEKN